MVLIVLFWLIIFQPLIASATTYYVDDTGTGVNCTDAQNIATPHNTIREGTACLTAPGDILYIRAGTYTQVVSQADFPSSGTAANPITIAAYNGETVIMQPGGATTQVLTFSGTTVRAYLVFDGIIFDGTSSSTCSGGNCQVIRIIQGANHFTIKNSTIRNGAGNGIFATGDGHTIINNTVHGNGTGSAYLLSNGMYLESPTNALIRGNTVHNNECIGIRVFSSASSPQATNNIIERNISHTNGNGKGLSGASTCSSIGAGVVVGDQNNIARWNVAYNNTTYGVATFGGGGTCTGNKVYGNTAYNNGTGLRNSSVCSSSLFQNNHAAGNTTNADFSAGSPTTVTNRTTGAITDCTVSTTDFTHKATSSCINAGTALVGYAYNGSAPDQGAFEMPVFSSCVVENGDASTIRMTFENNQNPPLLPSTAITGFTARKAGANDVITAAVRTGDNRVDLTLTDAIVGGNAVDISYSGSGNLTDSALIGNTTNQGYKTVLTNQSCTNNVGAAASHVFTQAAFEFHGLRGTEAAPVGTPYATAPENTNILVRVGGSVRLRIAVTCTTADCPPTGFFPRYSRNGGAYDFVVPDTFTADNIGFCGSSPDQDIPATGTATTDQLSTSGTFVAGAIVRTSNAIPTVDMALNGKTELEYCFSFDSDATAGDTYDIRIYQQDGTALNAYTVTPRMTLAAPSAGFGF